VLAIKVVGHKDDRSGFDLTAKLFTLETLPTLPLTIRVGWCLVAAWEIVQSQRLMIAQTVQMDQ